MRDDERKLELSFAAFSLTHAECGEEGIIELRLDERSLLGWCPSCAALETFGSTRLATRESRVVGRDERP
jgi:hypothetical protein